MKEIQNHHSTRVITIGGEVHWQILKLVSKTLRKNRISTQSESKSSKYESMMLLA